MKNQNFEKQLEVVVELIYSSEASSEQKEVIKTELCRLTTYRINQEIFEFGKGLVSCMIIIAIVNFGLILWGHW